MGFQPGLMHWPLSQANRQSAPPSRGQTGQAVRRWAKGMNGRQGLTDSRGLHGSEAGGRPKLLEAVQHSGDLGSREESSSFPLPALPSGAAGGPESKWGERGSALAQWRLPPSLLFMVTNRDKPCRSRGYRASPQTRSGLGGPLAHGCPLWGLRFPHVVRAVEHRHRHALDSDRPGL